MVSQPNDPRHQLNAAWQAASAALGEWRKQVASATSDAVDKLEPAVRAAADAARSAVTACAMMSGKSLARKVNWDDIATPQAVRRDDTGAAVR